MNDADWITIVYTACMWFSLGMYVGVKRGERFGVELAVQQTWRRVRRLMSPAAVQEFRRAMRVKPEDVPE